MSPGRRILAAVAAVALFAAAWFLQANSFNRLRRMRQLERIPRTDTRSVIEGEVNLAGRAVSAGEAVTSTHTSTECFYFLYTKEREETDSDGDTRWVEVDRVERFVPFALEDTAGRIRVAPAKRTGFHLSRDFSTEIGDYRYREWRLDSGDVVFVFGYARPGGDGLEVAFPPEGHYTPLVSQVGEIGERRGMATRSLGVSFLALLGLSFAITFLGWSLGLHRLVTFLTLVSLAQGALLTFMGVRLIGDDLTMSDARISLHTERASREIAGILAAGNVDWNGQWDDNRVFAEELAATLPQESFARVRGIYRDLAASISRHNQVLSRFPERWLAPAFGLAPRADLALAAEFTPESAEREIIEEAPTHPVISAIATAVGFPFALIASWLGFRRIREKRYIENIPTSSSSGLAWGPSEIKGTLETLESTVKGPLSGRDCLWYRYRVQERRGSGKNARWVTVSDDTVALRFLCRDAEGETVVDSAGAEVHSTRRHHRRSGRRRYYEWNLLPGDEIYALGSAVVDPETGDSLRLALGDGDFPFILTNMSENGMMLKKGRRGLLWLASGLNGFVLGALAIFGMAAWYAATNYLAAALLAPAFLGVCLVVMTYNDLQFVRFRVRRAWANIDVSLRKRADLVPNLETVVKKYLAHEKELHQRVVELRGLVARQATLDPGTAGEIVSAERAVTDRLLAVIESYPDLEGSEVTGALARQLVRLENEIALMRQGYNDSVERYNTRIGSFPELILARLFGFRDAESFKASIEVRKIPELGLGAD